MIYQCSHEQFLRDVAQHKMTVLRDEGLYRHVRFSRDGSSYFYFDLITWPGWLCYCGDMGTYVFRRLEDMFVFFRTDREYHKSKGRELAINPGYWSEKLTADSRFGDGCEEFDEHKFRKVINEYRIDWVRRSGLDKDDRRELWEAVDSQVLASLDDGEHLAMNAAYEFFYRIGGREFHFTDLFERHFTRYTFHFIWCCYALAWGIEQYDASKVEEIAA